MEPGEFMKLFDLCWFEMEILNKRISPSTSTSFESSPDLQDEESSSKPEFLRTTTLHTRSMSDQLNISTSFLGSDSFSPDSVLHPPKLHKIISGKEITEEELQEEEEEAPKKKVKNTRRKKGFSKSLSDLEFEELKGFMDLGFVFSEEDNKDSRLVEIIPGLQRLGKKEEAKEEEEEKVKETVHKAEISRPYLSEAWEVAEKRRRKENPLMNFKVPAFGNEVDIKDSLRWWAHTVASTVR
ncbi:hypothetical protein COLO4_31249 [Corchorus olitorius]|uniref:Uncharacterized protein n=1 Tax=Corchorus olitorius TaxID=93759 RepID=A0A1R3H546_9ROSI|nr:hypothetical protein COLO4_31249 [Corchorus olitorius]